MTPTFQDYILLLKETEVMQKLRDRDGRVVWSRKGPLARDTSHYRPSVKSPRVRVPRSLVDSESHYWWCLVTHTSKRTRLKVVIK